jgi:hypothetical protein
VAYIRNVPRHGLGATTHTTKLATTHRHTQNTEIDGENSRPRDRGRITSSTVIAGKVHRTRSARPQRLTAYRTEVSTKNRECQDIQKSEENGSRKKEVE